MVSTTVMISTFGTLSAVLLTSPRVLFAMADDGMLFAPIAKVHPKYQTPYVAIALVATLGLIFVLSAALREARRHVRLRDDPVLRAWRGGGLSPPTSSRVFAVVPDARLSGGAGALYRVRRLLVTERAH